MRPTELKPFLDAAVSAAREAGLLMRKNRHLRKKIADEQQHDIKLELDFLCQRAIEKRLRSSFPAIPILGEEGISAHGEESARWVVDPIDGTVNFSYGIPHACVSVALQTRRLGGQYRQPAADPSPYKTMLGVVYDPFCEEFWTAVCGGPARLNGRVVHVSRRRKLGETILSIGFAKQPETLAQMLPVLTQLIPHARKVRIMGAAALALVYVASGRFDAYIELGIRLWDIAAGGLILECAGGEFWRSPTAGAHTYQVIASNGLLRRRLRACSAQLREVFGAPTLRT